MMASILKIYFELLLNRKANWLEIWMGVMGIVDKKIAKIVLIENIFLNSAP